MLLCSTCIISLLAGYALPAMLPCSACIISLLAGYALPAMLPCSTCVMSLLVGYALPAMLPCSTCIIPLLAGYALPAMLPCSTCIIPLLAGYAIPAMLPCSTCIISLLAGYALPAMLPCSTCIISLLVGYVLPDMLPCSTCIIQLLAGYALPAMLPCSTCIISLLAGYALPAMFDSFNILKVKVSSRNNSVDDYLMVTDTDSSAREPVEEEDSRDFINRQNIVSSLDALPCTLASAQDLDEAFHLDSPSTSLACAIPTLKSSVISASQVTSRTNDFLSQDVRELWLTREPFMETTAGVASGGGEVRDSKVCPSDGVSKGEEILDSCSIGCSHDRGLSDTLTESVQNTSDFEQTFSASDNAPLQSFPLNTGALPPADMTSVNAPLQSSPLPADMTSVNAPLQSSPLNTGALPPADMTSVNAPLQSSPLNTGALPPAHTTDSDEALSKKTRKLDALQCPKLKADIKQGSCRRNMSDPCPKPMIYIKLKAFSDVRSISEPNEASR